MDLSSAQGELPIPMHAPASPYASGGSAGGRVLQQLHRERGNNKGNEESPVRLPPSPPAASEDRGSGKKRAAGGGGSGVKYRECLKNHAAAMGGNATDGCGEFMPSGEEGSLEALKCSACGCHRNFHRKEVDDDDEDLNADVCTGHGHRAGRRLLAPAMPPHLKSGGAGGGLLVTADPYGVGAYAAMRAVPPPPPLHHHHHQFVNAMPLSAVHTSEESDGMDGGAGARGSSSSLLSKKRFRTKFTAEQKARMLDFAERVGWRLQKLDDGMVHAFCQEIGVKRRVLKVWMHNNKHSLATKRLEAPPGMASAPAPPPPMPMVPPPPMQIVPPPPPALPSSPQPGPSFHLGGPSSQPPQHMAMPMVPPPPPPPPFHHRGPSSPAPLKLD